MSRVLAGGSAVCVGNACKLLQGSGKVTSSTSEESWIVSMVLHRLVGLRRDPLMKLEMFQVLGRVCR